MVFQVVLKKGREKSVMRGHPWIFAGAIEHSDVNLGKGETVSILSEEGQCLGWGAFSPDSQIRVRLWSSNPKDSIDDAFITARIHVAIQQRQALLSSQTDSVRLVHSEGDGLPGLIVDQYAGTLVFQILSAGMEYFHATVVAALKALPGITALVERSDADVRALEGLEPRVAVLMGEIPAEGVLIVENGLHYRVNPLEGHKTGFYLDQRDNRAKVEEYAKKAKTVLNCFCYTGGFSLSALRAGAREILSIDASEGALVLAQENADLNPGFSGQATWTEGDVFDELRRLRDRAKTFDLIILDPPKFAPTASHAERASRAYKDINLLALKLLNPGGRLITFSCSGGISLDLFRKIVAGSAMDAGVDAILEDILMAGLDHPVRVSFPEGEYLKGLVLRKL